MGKRKKEVWGIGTEGNQVHYDKSVTVTKGDKFTATYRKPAGLALLPGVRTGKLHKIWGLVA